jgi:hypothetical protein
MVQNRGGGGGEEYLRASLSLCGVTVNRLIWSEWRVCRQPELKK